MKDNYAHPHQIIICGVLRTNQVVRRLTLLHLSHTRHFLVNETNPYETPPTAPAQNAPSTIRTALSPNKVFTYSYFTSLPVAVTVVVIWLFVMFNDSAIPPSQRRTSPPDIVEWIFLIITTLPSVLTCLLFSFSYCAVFRVAEKRRLWPAVLFGAISGLLFNAMTAIWVIEYFFDW